jgi:plasmid stabilization system protein ParE
MKYEFFYEDTIDKDIDEVLDYYASLDNNKLVVDFLDRLEQAKQLILATPKGFQIKHKNVRTLLLKQFPYHIHYIIDDTKKQIIVLAITQANKKPKDYTKR